MDNENNIKRAELHVHTIFSEQQKASIEVLNAIEHAKELGLSSIAFCDYRSVDSFSEIMNVDDKIKSGIKVIYGAELPFETTTQTIKTRGLSLTLLAKNKKGIKALQELAATMIQDEYNEACKIINTDILKRNRENLLIGSTSYSGEIFNEIKWWWEFPKDFKKMAEFYDFIEISPVKCAKDKSIYERIIELSQAFKIPVVATSNAKHLTIDTAALAEYSFFAERYNHIYSIDELLEEFRYLGEDVARDVVINNPKIIADKIQIY